MIDQIYDRGYQHGRAALNRDLTTAGNGILRTIGDGLRALHRLEWNAPWNEPALKVSTAKVRRGSGFARTMKPAAARR